MKSLSFIAAFLLLTVLPPAFAEDKENSRQVFGHSCDRLRSVDHLTTGHLPHDAHLQRSILLHISTRQHDNHSR